MNSNLVYKRGKRKRKKKLVFNAPQPHKPGKTALYSARVYTVGEGTATGEGGTRRREIGVTCTFLFEALRFSSSLDPDECLQPSFALIFSWLFSSLLSSGTMEQKVKGRCQCDLSYILVLAFLWMDNYLGAQFSFFLFELCQAQS